MSSKFPKLNTGDRLTAAKVYIKGAKTEPPPRFTDGSLIMAMENIDKFVTDPEAKKRLREGSGIGTQATRGPLIKDLLKSGLLLKQKKKGAKDGGKEKAEYLIPSEQANELIDAIPKILSDPGMSALWETILSAIRELKCTPAEFLAKQEQMVRSITAAPLKLAAEKAASRPSSPSSGGQGGTQAPPVDPLPGDGDACPKCKKGSLRTIVVKKPESKVFGKRFLGCSVRECTFTKWPD